MLVFLAVLLFAGGCETDTITDAVTKEELDIIREPVPAWTKVTINSDAMLNYSSYNPMLAGNSVYVDKAYYRERAIARGDIVMFRTEDARGDFGRIIGLPTEEVDLKNGFIYIDGNKLDAFYGSEFRGKPNAEKEPTSLDQPVALGDNEYFVLGDYWRRSLNDSQTAGPFRSDVIMGKVVGWDGPKTAWDYQQGVIVGIASDRVAIVRDVSANALRVRSTEEIMNIAYPEALWAYVESRQELQSLKIGDIVKYELIGNFKLTTPLQARAGHFERIGSLLE